MDIFSPSLVGSFLMGGLPGMNAAPSGGEEGAWGSLAAYGLMGKFNSWINITQPIVAMDLAMSRNPACHEVIF